MNMFVRKLFLASAVLGVSLLTATTARAQDVSRGFAVTIEDGGLAGQIFSGSITFDESFLGNSVILFPEDFSLEFDFLGTTFTEEDDVFGFTTASLGESGIVTGLGYTVDSESPNVFFGFTPSDDSIGDEFFFEEFDATGAVVDSGEGQLSAVSVPEPISVAALGLVGLSALVGRKFYQAA